MAYPPPDDDVLPFGADRMIAITLATCTEYKVEEILAVLRHTSSVDATLQILQVCQAENVSITTVMSMKGTCEEVEAFLRSASTPFVASMQPTRFVPKVFQRDLPTNHIKYEPQGDPRTRAEKDADDLSLKREFLATPPII